MSESSQRVTFETGGRQYTVAIGDELEVPFLAGDSGTQVEFGRVLCVLGGSGTVVGKPHVEGASVSAEILRQGRDDKITIHKHKRRTGYQRTRGHRQPHTVVRITACQV